MHHFVQTSDCDWLNTAQRIQPHTRGWWWLYRIKWIELRCYPWACMCMNVCYVEWCVFKWIHTCLPNAAMIHTTGMVWYGMVCKSEYKRIQFNTYKTDDLCRSAVYAVNGCLIWVRVYVWLFRCAYRQSGWCVCLALTVHESLNRRQILFGKLINTCLLSVFCFVFFFHYCRFTYFGEIGLLCCSTIKHSKKSKSTNSYVYWMRFGEFHAFICANHIWWWLTF